MPSRLADKRTLGNIRGAVTGCKGLGEIEDQTAEIAATTMAYTVVFTRDRILKTLVNLAIAVIVDPIADLFGQLTGRPSIFGTKLKTIAGGGWKRGVWGSVSGRACARQFRVRPITTARPACGHTLVGGRANLLAIVAIRAVVWGDAALAAETAFGEIEAGRIEAKTVGVGGTRLADRGDVRNTLKFVRFDVARLACFDHAFRLTQ